MNTWTGRPQTPEMHHIGIVAHNNIPLRRNVLADMFELELPATIVFDHPTATTLATAIAAAVREQGANPREIPSAVPATPATSSLSLQDVCGALSELGAEITGKLVPLNTPLQQVRMRTLWKMVSALHNRGDCAYEISHFLRLPMLVLRRGWTPWPWESWRRPSPIGSASTSRPPPCLTSPPWDPWAHASTS